MPQLRDTPLKGKNMAKRATQKHMGKGVLVKRLAAQVKSTPLAKNILKKRGDMDASGKLTKKGQKRNNMTAKQRALDRAGGKGTYNPKTNSVTKGKKHGR